MHEFNPWEIQDKSLWNWRQLNIKLWKCEVVLDCHGFIYQELIRARLRSLTLDSCKPDATTKTATDSDRGRLQLVHQNTVMHGWDCRWLETKLDSENFHKSRQTHKLSLLLVGNFCFISISGVGEDGTRTNTVSPTRDVTCSLTTTQKIFLKLNNYWFIGVYRLSLSV